MYIELTEELNVSHSTIPSMESNIADLTESENNNSSSNLLYVPAEGLHSVITGNHTYYEPNCIKESIPAWTYPYNIPIIFHHKEKDSQIIGRIQKAKYIKKSKRTDSPALGFVLGIGAQEGKEGIHNKTLSTMSIGARALDLRCSICGKNIAKEGFCEHEKGRVYKDKLCYWIVKKMVPKEVSFVIVPSDKFAYCDEPLTKEDAEIMMSESYEEEVNELASNIFSDIFSQQLAEAQEEKIKAEANATKSKVEDEKSKEKVEEPKEKEEPETKIEDNKPEDNKDVEVEDNKTKEESNENKEKNNDEDPKDSKDNNVEKDSSEENNDKNNNDSIQEIISRLETTVATLTKDVEFFKNKYNEEKSLREKAEEKLIVTESLVKKDFVTKINDLRKTFGLTEKDETLLMGSNMDLLENEYNNLLEMSNSTLNCIKTVQKVKSNSYIDEASDNTNKVSIKESENLSASKEELAGMLSRFTRR